MENNYYKIEYDWWNPRDKQWVEHEIYIKSKFKAHLVYWFWKYLTDAPRVEFVYATIFRV